MAGTESGGTPGDEPATTPGGPESSDGVLVDRRTFIRGDSHGTIPRLLGSTRLFIAVAVLGLVAASVAVLINGTLLVFRTIRDVVANYGLEYDGAKSMSVEFVE